MFVLLATLIAQSEVPLGTFNPPTETYSTDSEVGTTALTNLESFISNLIGFLTALGAIMFVIHFVLGAFGWITSAGDKGKLEHARNRMLYGITGMILIVGAYALLGLLSGLIGIDFLNPAETIKNMLPAGAGL
jgi:hypothetical protein